MKSAFIKLCASYNCCNIGFSLWLCAEFIVQVSPPLDLLGKCGRQWSELINWEKIIIRRVKIVENAFLLRVSASVDMHRAFVSVNVDINRDSVSVSLYLNRDSVSVSVDINRDSVSVGVDINRDSVSVSVDINRDSLSVSVDTHRDYGPSVSI